ncbi:DUF11 domain-containing protein [Chitinophaga silvatica]|uniref:DUF11 domain-containing protein n=1 Tax=Chitinophaga silvatica TaxID=2282649 RepID=A0A3E1Y729_9BACT|nr:gliding motility-associated C-terminal domain-containing protein [Chitinophaga silvatica]RFS20711.1 DUF11 domain-containing protein [Chitinophaga silvatica]
MWLKSSMSSITDCLGSRLILSRLLDRKKSISRRYIAYITIFLSVFLPATTIAQSCTGSLGDPIFKETFGNAGTTVRPTLGPPLAAGTTTYTYYSPATVSRPVGPYPGQYTISNTTRGYNNTYFVDRPDHTTGDFTGYCMVVDANATPDQFYQRTITGLCAGTTFEFSAWIMNINPQSGVSKPSLRFDIMDANDPNGTPLASVSTGQVSYQSPGTWVRQAGVFRMPSTTSSVILKIFSNTPSSNGNDLALDDIAFAACGPPITFTQGSGPVCKGGTATLDVSLPAGSYSSYFFQLQRRLLGATDWTDVGSVVNNGGNNQHTFSVPNAVGGYEYRVVAAGGTTEISNVNCRVTSSPIELKVIDFTVSISGNQPICYNTSTQLSATINAVGSGTPSTGITYQWETSANGTSGWTVVAGQTGATLNTGALTANTYYRVTATVNGCSGNGASQSFLVNVNPNISATLGTVNSICEGTTVFSLPYTITSGSPNRYSLTSSDIPGFISITNGTLGASPISVVIPSGIAPGTYHFNITFNNSSSNCSSVTYPFTLNIDGKPSTSVAGPNQNLCGATSTILAANTPAVGTGTWMQVSGPTTASFANSNDPATTVSGLQPGNYVFRWVIANGSCASSSSTVGITITAPPTTANAGPDQTQYNTGIFIVNANAPTVGAGTWTVVSGTAFIANPDHNNTAVTLSPNTSATLVWTIENDFCPPSRDTIVLTYISLADIQIEKTILEQGPYISGQDFIYRIVVVNAGPSNATNVRITDPLPAGFIASGAATVNITGGAQVVQNNSTLTNVDVVANIPTNNGSSVIITISGKISPSFEGDLTNTATAVSPDVPDPNGATSTITVSPVRKPFFQAIKSAPSSTIAGSNISFNLVVNNTGLSDAVNTLISDQVSGKLTNVSWTATATGKLTILSGNTGTGNLVQVRANMPGGDTGKVYIKITGTVKSDATGNIDNVANITPTEVTVNPSTSNTTHTLITSSPGLIIDKSHTGGPVVIAGQPINYVLTLMNNGPSNSVNSVITDTLPAAIQNATWTATAQGAAVITSGQTGSGSIIRVVGSVPAGSSNNIIVNITGTVNPGFSGTITNLATATPSEPGIPPVTDIDVATVQKSLALTAVKSGPATAVAGESITYTLDVGNNGPSNSTATLISDNVPVSITNVIWTASIVSGTGTITNGGTGSGNAVQVTANLNAGSLCRIIIKGTIRPSAVNPIQNSAVVTPSELNIPVVNSNVVTTTLSQQASLNITKTGPDTASAGSRIAYTVIVTNNGPSNATGITISDIVPSTLQNVIWSAVGNGNATITSSRNGTGNNINLKGDIEAGTGNNITITIQGTVDPAFNGKITNTAIVAPLPGTGTTDSATKITTVNRLPQLAITKSASNIVGAGTNITYTITVSNISNANANNLKITDAVPAELMNVTWMAVAAGNATISGTNSGTGNNISLTGSIPAGSANTITVTVTGTTPSSLEGSITNTATATPSEPVPPVSATKVVRVRRIPNLTISKSGPSTAAAGSQITYKIIVTNISAADAQELTINDQVPSQVQQVTWSAVGTNGANIIRGANGTGNNVDLSADIPGGKTATVTITVTGIIDPTFSGTFQNGATYQPIEPGATPGSATPVVTTVTKQTALRISKSGPTTANSGNNVTYTILVSNQGPSSAANAVITDQVPALLNNVSWQAVGSGGAVVDNGATGTGNALRVTADIPVKGLVTITVIGTIPPDAGAQTISNFAIGTPSESGNPPVNSDTVVTTISSKPGLLITKVGTQELRAGEPVIYGIKVVNVGPSNAIGTVITDAIPAAVLNASWLAIGGGSTIIQSGASGSGNQVRVVADIPVGEQNAVTILINGTLKGDYSGTLENTAVATPAEPGVPPVSSHVTATVTREVKLQISKSGPAEAPAGSGLRYDIDITNAGPSDATNITIKDNLPAGLLNATWTATGVNGATITSGNTGTGNILLTGNIPNTPLSSIHITVIGLVDPVYPNPTMTNTAIVVNDPAVFVNSDTSTVITTISRLANLRLTKSGPANRAAGESIQYVLRVENNGPSTAVGAIVRDILPANILNATWTTTTIGNVTNISPTSGNGNVNLTADIPADSNTYLLVTITGIVSPAVTNNTTITNTGVVSLPPGTIVDPYPADNSSSVTTVIDNDPVIRISKSGPNIANINDSLVYRITVTNGGSGNITGALIQDLVPAAIDVTRWDASGLGAATVTGATSGTNNTIQTTGDIPVGAGNAIFILIQGRVKSTAGTTVTNTATVTAGGNKESSITTLINNATEVRLIKSGPQNILAGEPINYTIQIFNDGPRDANQLQITDVIPPAITNVSWKAVVTGNGSILDSMEIDSSGNIDLPAKLAAGRSNFITITISGIVDGNFTAGTIVNTANVKVTGLVDYNPANNTSTVETVVGRSTGVKIRKSGPKQAVAGNGITYRIVVTNDGPSNASGIKITDIVPAEIQNVSWNASVLGGASITGPFSGTTNNINTTANIPAGVGNSVVITVTGTLNNQFNGIILNRATASGTGIPEVSDSVSTQVDGIAAVDIQKNGPATVTAGGQIVYTITATNQGPAFANNLTVTDTLDSRIQGVTWTASTLNGAVIKSGGSGSGNQLSLVASIPPTNNAAVIITVTGTVAPGATGTLRNTATLTPELTVNPPVVSPPVITQILQQPLLKIVKSGPVSLGAGALIEYVLQVDNNGVSNAVNSVITDQVPAVIKNASWNVQSVSGGAVIHTGNTGTGNTLNISADIPAGAEILVAVKGTMDSAFEGAIRNTATITPSEPGVAADSSSAVTTVLLKPVLQVTKSGPAVIRSGDNITYTIVANNAGPSLALNALIQDVVPAPVSNVKWTAVASGNAKINGATSGSGNIIDVTGDLPTGSNDRITITVNGVVSPAFRDTLKNFAAAYPSEPNGVADTSAIVETVVVPQPILSITKSGPSTIIAGQQIIYNITVSNQGISDAVNAAITDLVPAPITQVSWQTTVTGTATINGSSSGVGNNINISANIPTGVNNTVMITVTGLVPRSATGTITNTAVVTPSEPGAGSSSSSTAVTIATQSNIQILKVGPTLMFRGQDAEYEIALLNPGPSDAKNVVITDLIPSVLQNVVWTTQVVKNTVIKSGATGNGNNLNIVADIPADTSGLVIRIDGIVDLNAPAGSVFNTAHASVNGTDYPSREVVSTVISTADLNIVKTATPQVYVGSKVIYTLTANNTGFANANNAVIKDSIPISIVNPTVTVLQTNNGAGNVQATIVNNKLTATLGNFPVTGQVVLQITGTATEVGTVTNTATITTPPDVTETNLPDNTSSASTVVLPKIDLNITKTINPVSGPYTVGQKVTYTLSATNAGNAGVNPVFITDTLPAANLLGDPTYVAPPRGTITFDNSSRVLQWNIGLLNAGETLNWSYDAIIKGTGNIKNVAIVTGPPDVSNPDTSTNVIQVTGTDLAITKAGPDTVYTGANITYTVTIDNDGPGAADGAVVKDTLSAQLLNPVISVTGTSNGAANVQTSVTGNIATATIGTFPANGKVVLQISGIAGQPGAITNIAVVNTPAGVPDTDSANNRSQTVNTIILAKSQLNITKSVTPDSGPYKVGQQLTYTLSASNLGQASAPSVVVTDTLPSAQLLSDPTYGAPPKGTVTYNSSTRVLVWNIGTLAAGENVTWNYNTVIKGAGEIRNIAIVTGPPDTTRPDTSIVPIIVASTDLSISKTGPAQVVVNGQVVYQLTIKNNGPDAADNAVMLDTISATLTRPQITVVQTTGGAGNVSTSLTGEVVRADIGIFPAGATVVIEIEGTASQVGIITNTAVINTPAGVPDLDSSNNRSATIITQVTNKTTLNITKTVSPPTGPYAIGQQVTYTLTVNNPGTTVIDPVVVTDQLPAATELGDPVFNAPAKGSAVFNSADRRLIWTVGALNGGETATWSYTTEIKAAGAIKNIAVVEGPPDISNPGTDTVIINTAKYANLKITKQLTTPLPLNVNQVLQFVITVENNGPDTATGVVMKDPLENKLQQATNIVTTKGVGVYDISTRSIIWTIPDMAPGTKETLTFNVKLMSGGTLTNTATVAGNEIDPDLSDNTVTITQEITGRDIDIPNTITPDGDGKNDHFVIPGIDRYPGSILDIYNRWGNQVYHSNNYDNTWDGHDLNEGTYYYILRLRTPQGERKYKGWILLIR